MYALLLVASLAQGAAALTCTATMPGQCYSDEAGPRALNVSLFSADSTSADICAQQCAQGGYPLAGVTGHTTPTPQYLCYCGLAIVPKAAPAPASDCSLPCPANASQPCGGMYRLSVYRAHCDGPLPPPPTPLAPGPACSQPETRGLPFCNAALPFAARAADLVARITLAEIGPQLTARNSPAIPRLGIPPFYWGVNNVHGITNGVSGPLCTAGGKCATIWPSGPSLGATFNSTLFREMGHNTGVEMRAFNNIQWGPTANPASGMDGLSSWGPTINLVRDNRWGRIQGKCMPRPDKHHAQTLRKRLC